MAEAPSVRWTVSHRMCEKGRMHAKRYRQILGLLLAGAVSAALLGCGYSIRGGKSDALAADGVRKIFIAPVVNDTYDYGVENVVYNSLVRSLAAFSGIRLVDDPELADAVLAGRVIQARADIISTTQASALNPGKLPTPNSFGSIYIASAYNAILTATFTLVRRDTLPGHPRGTIWSGSFARSKPYPGSNQLGVLGTTSGLINDSEFDRTIVDISHNMAIDVREAMVSRF